MNETPFFSIICPAYNSEKYLLKCIDSVVQQTYTSWELIIVNDGSTDSTSKIIDDFEKNNACVKGFFQKNNGQAIARNNGLSHVKGKYVLFLDSDDYLDPDYLLNAFLAIKKTSKIDVFCTNFTYHKNKKNMPITMNESEMVFEQPSIYSIFLTSNRIHSGPVAKFYNLQFLQDNNLKFPNFKEREDIYFLNKVFCNAKRVVLSGMFGYNVLLHKGSVESNGFNVNKLLTIKAGELAIQNCKEKYPLLIDDANYYMLRILIDLIKTLVASKHINSFKKEIIFLKQIIDEYRSFAKTKEEKKLVDLFFASTYRLKSYLFILKLKGKLAKLIKV